MRRGRKPKANTSATNISTGSSQTKLNALVIEEALGSNDPNAIGSGEGRCFL